MGTINDGREGLDDLAVVRLAEGRAILATVTAERDELAAAVSAERDEGTDARRGFALHACVEERIMSAPTTSRSRAIRPLVMSAPVMSHADAGPTKCRLWRRAHLLQQGRARMSVFGLWLCACG